MDIKNLVKEIKEVAGIETAEEEAVVEEAKSLDVETKANEVMHTTNTGFGKEVIEKDVMLDPMLDLVPEYSKLLPMLPWNHGNNMPISAKVPVIGEADLFQGNSEWTTGAGSFITPANHWPHTGEVTITQGQFITTVSISKRELNYGPSALESIVRERINRAAARTIDAVLINADAETGATGNVNLDDDTPTSGTYYLQQDHGIRELAINGSNTVSCGTLDSWDFLAVKALLDGGYQADLDNLLFITDSATYNKMLALTELITVDKFGPQATIHSGVLAKIFGIDVLVARDYPLSEADGKCSKTAASNSKWGFACIYKPAVQYGFGQPLEIEAYKVPGKWVDLVATFEFGFAIAYSVAGLGKTVACGINATV